MCTTPIMLRNPCRYTDRDSVFIPIDCGKCVECHKKKTNQWWIRLKYELKFALSAHFITLTYAFPPISKNGYYTGDKNDLRKFFNRLRHYESTLVKNPKTGRKKRMFNENIKYYACLEYGSTYQRPHYHFIIFNLKDVRSVFKAWAINDKPIGTIHDEIVCDGTIRYVTGYQGKKIGIPQSNDDDRIKEYSVMSKNLGISYLTLSGEHNTKHNDNAVIMDDGYTYPLPRYFKNKLFPAYKANRWDKVKKQLKTVQRKSFKAHLLSKNAQDKHHEYIKRKEAINPDFNLDRIKHSIIQNNHTQTKKSKLS